MAVYLAYPSAFIFWFGLVSFPHLVAKLYNKQMTSKCFLKKFFGVIKKAESAYFIDVSRNW